MKISIVIPCFKEDETILKIVDELSRTPIENKDITIVGDGSYGGTQDKLLELADNS